MQNKCTKRIKHYIRDVQNLEQRSQRPRKKTSIFAFTLCTALCVKDYTLPFVQEKGLWISSSQVHSAVVPGVTQGRRSRVRRRRRRRGGDCITAVCASLCHCTRRKTSVAFLCSRPAPKGRSAVLQRQGELSGAHFCHMHLQTLRQLVAFTNGFDLCW